MPEELETGSERDTDILVYSRVGPGHQKVDTIEMSDDGWIRDRHATWNIIQPAVRRLCHYKMGKSGECMLRKTSDKNWVS